MDARGGMDGAKTGDVPDTVVARGYTRRQVLIAGGVALGTLAAGAVVAQRTLPLRSYWYRLTGQCGPEGPLPEDLAAPQYGTFRSRVLGREVEYGWWAPTILWRQRSGFRLPVCYCLPARGQGPRWVLDGPVHLADFLATPGPGGGVLALELVAVAGGESYWHERAGGEDRMTMLLDEFIPWFEARGERGTEEPDRGAAGEGETVGGGRDDDADGGGDREADGRVDVGGRRTRAARAVMGWSMGGYGALLAAERRPDMFAAVCAVSPALWRSYDEAVGDAFDDARDFAENDVFAGIPALRRTAVRVDCGRADVFFDAARDFAARCAARTGRPVAGDLSDGCHDADYWRRVAPGELRFIARAVTEAMAQAS